VAARAANIVHRFAPEQVEAAEVHLIHWADGGPTNVNNGTLLCRRHHTQVHHHGWTSRMINNQPHAIPPRWLDHTQTPRLHSRFTTRQLQP
jgi:5-methylcytosine-specific restriction protein A